MHATRTGAPTGNTSSGLTIGERLAAARKHRGISYEDAAAATKLSVAYLQAMEANQFDLMPAPIYAKNFIRIYGNYLGLDGRQLAEEYGRTVSMSVQLPPKTEVAPTYHVSVLVTYLLRHRVMLGMLVVVVVVLMLYLGSALERSAGGPPVAAPGDPQVAAALRDYKPMFDTTEPLPSLE